MNDLIIVGASGFGREIADCVYDINAVSPTWNLLGFIDDNLEALNGKQSNLKVLDTIKDHTPKKDVSYVCALAFPEIKEKIILDLKRKGAQFATLIHPLAVVSPSALLGEGCVITHFSNVSCNTKIGNFVSILASGVAHDVSIGDFSTLSGHVYLNGNVTVGRSVYLGCGSMVAPSKTVSSFAKISIGSVVISNVKEGYTMYGNPARKFNL